MSLDSGGTTQKALLKRELRAKCGWLIVQGREVFEHVVADPDALAELPVVRAQAPGEAFLECEDTLYIAAKAHRAVTGVELPPHSIPIPYRSWIPHGTSTLTIELR